MVVSPGASRTVRTVAKCRRGRSDGKWVYFSTSHTNAANIWKLPVGGGAAQPVTANSGIYAAESADRKYVYYSRNAHDSAIWRTAIAGGPEEQVPDAPKPFDDSHWALVASGIYIVDGNGDLLFYKFERCRRPRSSTTPAFSPTGQWPFHPTVARSCGRKSMRTVPLT